ncbi:MAG TPA: glycosyltransferase family 4 protein [Mycobacteriales bacterium]|nr:glycosyltransferase family 4 protein [Mycobacteriales bacterium]
MRRLARSARHYRAGIRILFTHPYFWPHVTRGAEREIHDLATRLVERGHQVTLLTSQPSGLTRRATIDGINVRYVRVPHRPRARPGYGLDETAMFALPALATSLLHRADVVHCWHYADAAAVIGRGRPTFLKVTGSVTPEWMQRSPMHDRLLRRALARTDEVWCNSEWARGEMSGFGREMGIVPAGVDRTVFQPVADRAEQPTVLSTSAPDEPRKRLVDLLAGWGAVRAAVPDAQLRIAGNAPTAIRDALLAEVPDSDRGSVHFLGSLGTGELAREYSAAWLSVMPAVLEALGLSTLESLACGTPVLGADSGHTPALVAPPGAGAVFRPADPADLARVVGGHLAAGAPKDRDACRSATDRYDWERIVTEVETAYQRRALA